MWREREWGGFTNGRILSWCLLNAWSLSQNRNNQLLLLVSAGSDYCNIAVLLRVDLGLEKCSFLLLLSVLSWSFWHHISKLHVNISKDCCPLDVAWVVARHDCYLPHPGSIPCKWHVETLNGSIRCSCCWALTIPKMLSHPMFSCGFRGGFPWT